MRRWDSFLRATLTSDVFVLSSRTAEPYVRVFCKQMYDTTPKPDGFANAMATQGMYFRFQCANCVYKTNQMRTVPEFLLPPPRKHVPILKAGYIYKITTL